MDEAVDDEVEANDDDIESADAASDDEDLYDKFVSCCK